MNTTTELTPKPNQNAEDALDSALRKAIEREPDPRAAAWLRGFLERDQRPGN